jgi:hypothetical protein
MHALKEKSLTEGFHLFLREARATSSLVLSKAARGINRIECSYTHSEVDAAVAIVSFKPEKKHILANQVKNRATDVYDAIAQYNRDHELGATSPEQFLAPEEIVRSSFHKHAQVCKSQGPTPDRNLSPVLKDWISRGIGQDTTQMIVLSLYDTTDKPHFRPLVRNLANPVDATLHLMLGGKKVNAHLFSDRGWDNADLRMPNKRYGQDWDAGRREHLCEAFDERRVNSPSLALSVIEFKVVLDLVDRVYALVIERLATAFTASKQPAIGGSSPLVTHSTPFSTAVRCMDASEPEALGANVRGCSESQLRRSHSQTVDGRCKCRRSHDPRHGFRGVGRCHRPLVDGKPRNEHLAHWK